MSATCLFLSAQIPLYRGAREALVLNPPSNNPPFNGVDGFGDVSYPNEPNLSIVKEEIAASAMYRYVKQVKLYKQINCISKIHLSLIAAPEASDSSLLWPSDQCGTGHSDLSGLC